MAKKKAKQSRWGVDSRHAVETAIRQSKERKPAKRFGWGWVKKETRRRVKRLALFPFYRSASVYVWSVSSRASAQLLCHRDERVVRVPIREV
jgi:hypothetical protein